MTEKKATDILDETLNDIFRETASEIGASRMDVERGILFVQDIEAIRSLVDRLDAIGETLRDIDHSEDDAHDAVSYEEKWYNYSLLRDLIYGYRWLPEKDEDD